MESLSLSAETPNDRISKNWLFLGTNQLILVWGMEGIGDGGAARIFRQRRATEGFAAADDPLERLAKVVDFEVFRGELEAALSRSDRAKGGRPPYEPVLMFKVLVLQTLYTVSEDQTEYQLKDRLLFSIAASVKPRPDYLMRCPFSLRLMTQHGALASLRGRR